MRLKVVLEEVDKVGPGPDRVGYLHQTKDLS